MAPMDRDTAMSADASINPSPFYQWGCVHALTKLGASLLWPPDQTFQRHRDVESPATNVEEDSPSSKITPTHANVGAIWDEHDKRHMQKMLPEHDNFTGA